MNSDDIIRMAREAHMQAYPLDTYAGHIVNLERFATLIAAAEREACAKVAAWILKMPENDVSAAIRARGQE